MYKKRSIKEFMMDHERDVAMQLGHVWRVLSWVLLLLLAVATLEQTSRC